MAGNLRTMGASAISVARAGAADERRWVRSLPPPAARRASLYLLAPPDVRRVGAGLSHLHHDAAFHAGSDEVVEGGRERVEGDGARHRSELGRPHIGGE